MSSPLKILIIGASGFIGGHLLRRFASDDCELEAWSRSPVEPPLGAEGRFVHKTVDLLGDAPLPEPSLGGWDVVIHLAGESRPARFVGSKNLRETVRMAARVAGHIASVSPGCRFFLNSSAYVYAPSETPRDESSLTDPTGPYGLAKLLAEDLTKLYRDRFHLTIIRPFNLIGEGLPDALFASGLLNRLREAGASVQIPAPDVHRDLLDIRDAVEAYAALLAAEYESGAIFNLCSGRATKSSEFADALLDGLGQSCDVRFEGESSDSLIGTCDRLRSVANWAPKYQVQDAARAMVEAHQH